MIVVNNRETSMESNGSKKSLEDMFRMELDAYCEYREWEEETEDSILEMALEEIMMDEFLHARFLRDYMLDKEMYMLKSDDPYEKKYWKIHKRLFQD